MSYMSPGMIKVEAPFFWRHAQEVNNSTRHFHLYYSVVVLLRDLARCRATQSFGTWNTVFGAGGVGNSVRLTCLLDLSYAVPT